MRKRYHLRIAYSGVAWALVCISLLNQSIYYYLLSYIYKDLPHRILFLNCIDIRTLLLIIDYIIHFNLNISTRTEANEHNR